MIRSRFLRARSRQSPSVKTINSRISLSYLFTQLPAFRDTPPPRCTDSSKPPREPSLRLECVADLDLDMQIFTEMLIRIGDLKTMQ
jgi:hypothetical protein